MSPLITFKAPRARRFYRNQKQRKSDFIRAGPTVGPALKHADSQTATRNPYLERILFYSRSR